MAFMPGYKTNLGFLLLLCLIKLTFKTFVMKKLSGSNLGIVVIAVLTLFYGLPSCKQAGEKTQEKTLEKAIEQGGGEKADVDIDDQKITIETEEGKMQINADDNQWPANAPAEVPELKVGQIAGTTTSESEQGRNWSIRYTGVPTEELDRYGAVLKSKGFKITTMKGPKGGMVSGEKGNLGVIFTVSEKISSVVIMEQKQ